MSEIYCTAATPWDRIRGRATGDRIIHPDAQEVGEQEDGYPGGDIITLECPHCGVRFKTELPQ